jgi:hypothetical protein
MADFGWAHVVGSQARGPKGSVQLAGHKTELRGDPRLIFDDDGVLQLSGSLNVSGTINANQLNINVTNKNVTNIEQYGSTNFGDSEEDTHIFTGQMTISASENPFTIYGIGESPNPEETTILAIDVNNQVVKRTISEGLITSYSNYEDNRVITSVGATGINAEANLLFDGSLLTVTGDITASNLTTDSIISQDIDTNLMEASVITSSVITDGVLNVTGGNITSVVHLSSQTMEGIIQTQHQENITRVGTLDYLSTNGNLTINGTAIIDTNLNRMGIGTLSPEKPLEVLNEGGHLRLTYSKEVFGLSSARHTDLQTNASGDFIVSPTSGRLGLGTSTPNATLDVNGDAIIAGDLTVSGTLRAQTTDFVVSANTMTLGDEATDQVVFNASTGSIPNDFKLGNNIHFKNNGAIGVGSVPEAPLHVKGELNQVKISDQNDQDLTISVSGGGAQLSVANGNISSMNDFSVNGNTILGINSSSSVEVIGKLSASVEVKSDIGDFNNIKTNLLTNDPLQISGGSISNAISVSANTLGGTLTTAAQPNVTSLGSLTSLNISGDLTVDSSTLKVDSATDRVGIGKTNPQKPLEVKSTDSQLRLTYSDAVFGISSATYSDIGVNSSGHLSLSSTGGRVGIGTTSPTKTLEVNGEGLFNGDLHVEGTLFANEVKVRVTEIETIHLSTTGSTTFGDTSDDIHVFNGTAVHKGGVAFNRKEITENYSMTYEDHIIAIRANQNVTITLPLANTLREGQTFLLKEELGSALENVIVVQAPEGNTLDGNSHITLTSPHAAIGVYTDGVGSFYIF